MLPKSLVWCMRLYMCECECVYVHVCTASLMPESVFNVCEYV